jgi:hypothetical protein
LNKSYLRPPDALLKPSVDPPSSNTCSDSGKKDGLRVTDHGSGIGMEIPDGMVRFSGRDSVPVVVLNKQKPKKRRHGLKITGNL